MGILDGLFGSIFSLPPRRNKLEEAQKATDEAAKRLYGDYYIPDVLGDGPFKIGDKISVRPPKEMEKMGGGD